MDMKTTKTEIAGVALCSDKAVARAIEGGRFDPESLESVINWVMKMRVKSLGFLDVLDTVVERRGGEFSKMVTAENVDVIEKHWVDAESQEEK